MNANHEELCPLCAALEDEDDLDGLALLEFLSDHVLELIEEKELDEAEQLAQALLEDFPDQIDGLDRLARVYEAKENFDKALEYFRRAHDFTLLKPGFDDGSREAIKEDVRRVEQKANKAGKGKLHFL